MNTLFAIFPFNQIGPMEIIVLVVLGILLFGKKLPQMGHYLGKSIVEFKKGVKGLEDDIDSGSAPPPTPATAQDQIRAPQRVAATAPKFEDTPANVGAAPKV
jgi:sec-independent protein translocase protein TatA